MKRTIRITIMGIAHARTAPWLFQQVGHGISLLPWLDVICYMSVEYQEIVTVEAYNIADP